MPTGGREGIGNTEAIITLSGEPAPRRYSAPTATEARGLLV